MWGINMDCSDRVTAVSAHVSDGAPLCCALYLDNTLLLSGPMFTRARIATLPIPPMTIAGQLLLYFYAAGRSRAHHRKCVKEWQARIDANS